MRIAVVADIHGNYAALEAVIGDMRRHTPDLVLNLGDSLSGPLESGHVADRLMDLDWLSITSNHDRQMATLLPDAMGPSDRAAYDQLQPRHLAWLRGLKSRDVVAQEITLFHGTPDNDNAYLLDVVVSTAIQPAAPGVVAARLHEVTTAVVLCAHSHTPRLMRLANGQVIFNPGSVGVQAYRYDVPAPHRVEIGSPHARYGLIENTRSGWSFTHFAVPYDWEHASRKAREAGRMDWAFALRTGFVES